MKRTTISDLLDLARRRITRYEPAAAARAGERDAAILVDLRCQEDRVREGVVEGSVPIARTVLEWRADPESPWRDARIADTHASLILMCNDGYSSSLAAATLVEMGFVNVGDVVGGFRAWKTAGLPVIWSTAAPPGIPTRRWPPQARRQP
jgi:rhodanese-related sulfurtransferase